MLFDCLDHVSGEYKTICDGLLDGYKNKVYGANDLGLEYYDSETVQRVIIQNGKVISATGELEGIREIYDLSEDNNDNKDGVNNTNNILNETIIEKNDTKLPQTGKETNTFANWLSIVILLGIFWLGSMLLIEYEKRKMKNK